MSDLVSKLLVFIPLLFFAVISLKKSISYELQPISKYTSIALLIIMSILMSLSPIEEGNDKYYYMFEFLGETQDRNNEIGWVLLLRLLRVLLRGYFFLFFFVVALFYSFSYYFLAKKLFPLKTIGYFIIMVTSCMGFTSYGSNAIRAGFAISLLLLALSLKKNQWVRLIIILSAVLVHKTMMIPVLAFFIAGLSKSTRPFVAFWIFCLLFSLLNFDLGYIFSKIGFLDQRVEEYADSIGSDSDYGSRFRYDFLLYSLAPIYIARLYINNYNYSNKFYLRVYKAYIIANAIWLLVIRMAFSDRMAYLSWFMIPILALYPLLNEEIRVKHPQRIISLVISVFACVHAVLFFR